MFFYFYFCALFFKLLSESFDLALFSAWLPLQEAASRRYDRASGVSVSPGVIVHGVPAVSTKSLFSVFRRSLSSRRLQGPRHARNTWQGRRAEAESAPKRRKKSPSSSS